MLEWCLILGMTLVYSGNPHDVEYHGGFFADSNQCQLAGKDWRKSTKADNIKNVWTVCSPKGTTGFQRCEKLDEK